MGNKQIQRKTLLVSQDGQYSVIKQNNLLFFENTLFFSDFQEFVSEKDAILKRNQINARIPKIISSHSKQDSCICSDAYQIQMRVEGVLCRLSEVSQLSVLEWKSVAISLLETNRVLEGLYSYKFTEEKAFFSQQGQVLLWINDNIFQSSCNSISVESNAQRIKAIVKARGNSLELNRFLDQHADLHPYIPLIIKPQLPKSREPSVARSRPVQLKFQREGTRLLQVLSSKQEQSGDATGLQWGKGQSRKK